MKNIQIYLIAIFIILVTVFDRMGDMQYGNYVFVLVAVVSLSPLMKLVFKHWDVPMSFSVGFAIWSSLTLFWCQDKDFSFTRAITVLLMQLLFFVIASYAHTSYSKKLLSVSTYSFLVGAVIMFLLTLFFFQSGLNMDMLRDSNRAETEVDSNLIGRILALGATSCLFFYYEKKKFVNLILMTILAFLVVVLKTKGGLLSLVAGCGVLMFVKYYDEGRIGRYIGITLFLVLIFFAGINAGFFGDAFIRMEGMFDFFKSNDAIDDESTYKRMLYIEYGWKLMKSHPIEGYGIGAANYLLNGSYFHNNYIQLLVETGIIGFTVFYRIMFWLIRRLWEKRTNGYCMLYFSLMIVLMLSDISNTTYYAKLNYIIMGLSYVSIKNVNRENMNSKIIISK